MNLYLAKFENPGVQIVSMSETPRPEQSYIVATNAISAAIKAEKLSEKNKGGIVTEIKLVSNDVCGLPTTEV